MHSVSVREWGKIVSKEVDKPDNTSLDKVYLPPPTWQILADLIASDEDTPYLRFISPTTIQIKNYVGVITAGDWQIEILPKIDDSQDLNKTRNILWKMLSVYMKLPFVEATEAAIRIQENTPLPEELIELFLKELTQVVRRGIRKDYERVEAEERFLKGQLQVAKQMRQPPGRQHLFQIEYDVFSDNRAENRLIHSALVRVSCWTQNLSNQRLARELRFAFDDVPQSQNIKKDFDRWRTSRDMHYYQPLLPWLKLILNQQSPFALQDKHQGISFLFPMEKLFEGYVAHILRSQLAGYELKPQSTGSYLAKTTGKPVFMLKPDLLLCQGGQVISVLDTKWKLMDANKTYANTDDDTPKRDFKHGILQADMYQLFAYGQRFLNGEGSLVLIYPAWQNFGHDKPIEPFEYIESGLTLRIMPFCLEKGFKDGDLQTLLL